ncbi:hypothetical protein D6C93_07944 [Aureobasidium pullulans]|nr:hypothetical protein D6C93_07944 [Aureobasidium pullulans]
MAFIKLHDQDPEYYWFQYVGAVAHSVFDEIHVNIAMSKAYTLLEPGSRKLPAKERIFLTIWLAYLTPVWQEAETLKYTACQDYLIYLCRGQQPLIDVECWIDCLGMKTALNTPVDGLSHLLDQLRLVDELFGEYFRENRFEQIIMDPMVLLEHNAFMSFMVTGKKPSNLLRFKSQPPTEIGSSLKPGEKSVIELETVRYFQKLNQDCATLETVLGVFGEKIKRRRQDIERYHEQIRVVVEGASYKHDDLLVALKVLEAAEAGEEADVAAWRGLDDTRQTMLITTGRLQCMLDIKKKSNHNKNKNRSLKKKLQQGGQQDGQQEDQQDNQQDDHAEIMGGEAELIVVADTVVKAEEKGEAFVQPWCVDNVLQKMD